jgi:hypothetical protein
MTTKQKPNPFLAIKAAHDAETPEPEVQPATRAQVHKTTSAPIEPKRNPRGIRIRDDIFKTYRILAVEEGVPLYELIEAALEEHLKTRKRNNKAT